jgi:hypothetical protein
MKLTLHDLRLQRIGEPPKEIEGMAPVDYIHLAAQIELEIAGRAIQLQDGDGRWVGLHRFAEKICALRDWLAVPQERAEMIVDTHAIGGYGMRFRLNDGGVAVTVRKNEDRASEQLRESLETEAVLDALRGFKHQLRSELTSRVSPAAANRTWSKCFNFDVDADPFV